MRTRILIIGYYGFGNAGDELMLDSLLREIRALDPSAAIAVISGNEEETRRRHRVATIPYQVAGRLRRWSVILKTLLHCDLLLFGGGTFLQDYGFRGWRPIFYYLKLVVLARLLGKRVAILGAGAGPLDTAAGRTISSAIITLSEIAVLRDRSSLDLLLGLGCSPLRMRLGADLALVAAPRRPEGEGGRRRKVGVSFFPFFEYVHGDAARQQRMTEEVGRLLTELSREGELHFFCFQEDVDGADNVYARALAERYGIGFRTVSFSEGTEAFLGAVSEMDCVIGMRYHFLLLALLSGVTEVVAVSYHPKVSALMREMDLEENAVELEQFSAAAVLALVRRVKRHDPDSAPLQEYLARSAVNSRVLAELIGAPPRREPEP